MNDDGYKWLPMYFKKKPLMKAWKYQIISFLREQYKSNNLIIPKSLKALCPDIQSFNRWLNTQYQKYWIVHFAKPTSNHNQIVNYLGRYLKKPPIAQSRLRYYNGDVISFNYLNHRTEKHQDFTCSPDEFIRRFIQHIPAKNFPMICYYGILANRNRSKYLPLVYQLLEQKVPQKLLPVRWDFLLKKELGFNPLECILCSQRLKLMHISVGLSSRQLMAKHEKLAKSKPVH